jgi:hypothetical protein
LPPVASPTVSFCGAAADTIYLGNDGETVNGGKSHDLIYGGTGADTFAFSSLLATD